MLAPAEEKRRFCGFGNVVTEISLVQGLQAQRLYGYSMAQIHLTPELALIAFDGLKN